MPQMLEKLALMLAPFAPYVAQEIWEELGHDGPSSASPGPASTPNWPRKTKPRSSCRSTASCAAASCAPFGTPKEELERLALADEKVKPFLEGKQVVKIITVPDKLVNIVVK